MDKPNTKERCEGLRQLRSQLCVYSKQPCDCKFIQPGEGFRFGHERGSGCAEIGWALEQIDRIEELERENESLRKDAIVTDESWRKLVEDNERLRGANETLVRTAMRADKAAEQAEAKLSECEKQRDRYKAALMEAPKRILCGDYCQKCWPEKCCGHNETSG